MVTIRTLTTMEEMQAVHQLETKIWESEIVPTHQTITVVRNGGLIIGAYIGERLVGFSYSFPGYQHGKLYLCSHMLGVDPQYRSQGIGEQLKWEQLAIAKQLGYERITWTYDPLQTRNGFLNLTKLRGIASTYVEDCYGDLNDGINKGLPTDRLEVSWNITNTWIEENQAVPLKNVVTLNEIFIENGKPIPQKKAIPIIENNIYGVLVTNNFDQLKKTDTPIAFTWRLHIREMFQQLFAKNYAAVKLNRNKTENEYIFIPKALI